jgi:uncharacterized membrane protein YhaH (DUF805 family)
MADSYYYLENGAQQGPVDRDRLVAVLTSQLTPDTLVWREGLADWIAANQLPELAPALAAKPVVPPLPSVPPVPAAAAPAAEPTGDAVGAPSLNPFTVFGRTFSWTGKFNRGEFLVAFATNWVAGMLFGAIIGIAVALGMRSMAAAIVAGLIGVAWLVVMTISGLGAVVRRVHDLGVSPWLILLAMVPLANIVWFIYLFVAPGNPQAPAVQPAPVAPVAVVIALVVLSMLATLAAIGIPAFLAARRSATSVDMSAVSTSVSQGLQSQLSLPIATVACPTETRPLKAGDAFECVATPEMGGELTVKVTQQDEKGNVTWEVAKTEGLIDLQTVEQSVVKGLKEQANVDATVTCGGKYRASNAGEVFECQAKTPDGRQSVVGVTITDAQGHVSWEIKQ